MIRAGRLDRKITLQQRVSVGDGFGAMVDSWADLCPPVWAARRDLRGAAYFAAQHDIAEQQTTFTIRARVLPTTDRLRVVAGEAIYRVDAIAENGREALDLMCVAQGV